MSCMAVDIAQVGADRTVLCWRYDTLYAAPVSVPGAETPTGKEVASLVVRYRDNPLAPVILDVGGGYAGGAIERLKANNIEPTRFNGANASHKTSNDGAKLSFCNLKAEAYLRFREALHPDQPGGSPICLSDLPEVRADLAAPRWTLEARGIQIESKDDIRKRLGRSPDIADAIVMCCSTGQSAIREQVVRRKSPTGLGPKPRQTHCNVGYAHMKRRRPSYGRDPNDRWK